MEASGLRRILTKMKLLNHPQIERQIVQYEEKAEVDFERITEKHNESILRDFQDPWDVFRAILSSVEGSRAHDFFVSAMQHLLLIREQGEQRVRYFQLIDSLITSVVLDRKSIERDFSNTLGVSVANLAGRFADQERFEEEAQKSRTFKMLANQLKREKKELENQLAAKDDAVVGQLQTKLYKSEEDLTTSRQASNLLTAKIEDMAKQHHEQMSQQDLQIRELFNMLKESRALDDVQEVGGVLDRRELMGLMEKKVERLKTIQRLEGRHLPQTPRPATRRREGSNDRDGLPHPSDSRSAGSNGQPGLRQARQSAFEDADEKADMRMHIERTLANGSAHLGLINSDRSSSQSPQSTRLRDRSRGTPSPIGGRSAMQYSSPHYASANASGSKESTPVPTRAQQALANLRSSSGSFGSPSAAARFGARSALPAGLLADIKAHSPSAGDADTESEGTDTRGSGSHATALSTETAATSMESMRDTIGIGSPQRPPKSHRRVPTNESVDLELQSSARDHLPETADSSPDDPSSPTSSRIFTNSKTLPKIPAPPPPPPPPPPPSLIRTNSAPASTLISPATPPSAPPLPYPLATGNSVSSSGYLQQIKNRAVVLKPGAKIVEGDAVVGPAGSVVSPPPRGIWIPPPPGVPGGPPPPPPSAASMDRKGSAGPNGLSGPRKDAFLAKSLMKQVVWEKINPIKVDSTIWGADTFSEQQLVAKLQKEGIFEQMEEDFQAKKSAVPVTKKRKQELVTVLDAKVRERIGRSLNVAKK